MDERRPDGPEPTHPRCVVDRDGATWTDAAGQIRLRLDVEGIHWYDADGANAIDLVPSMVERLNVSVAALRRRAAALEDEVLPSWPL